MQEDSSSTLTERQSACQLPPTASNRHFMHRELTLHPIVPVSDGSLYGSQTSQACEGADARLQPGVGSQMHLHHLSLSFVILIRIRIGFLVRKPIRVEMLNWRHGNGGRWYGGLWPKLRTGLDGRLSVDWPPDRA